MHTCTQPYVNQHMYVVSNGETSEQHFFKGTQRLRYAAVHTLQGLHSAPTAESRPGSSHTSNCR
eukprot:4956631-Lingulodinium_polyedra.AAC.1